MILLLDYACPLAWGRTGLDIIILIPLLVQKSWVFFSNELGSIVTYDFCQDPEYSGDILYDEWDYFFIPNLKKASASIHFEK